MIPYFHRAQFLISAAKLSQLPDCEESYEVAFAGRSNAGKSSAINTLTHQKALARTSKTPGRTQQIVIFELDPEQVVVTHAAGAGCYGHNGADDVAADAAIVARARPGRAGAAGDTDPPLEIS